MALSHSLGEARYLMSSEPSVQNLRQSAKSADLLEVGEPAWDQVIRAERRILEIPWRELWKYRDLVWMFAQRDVSASYKQTVLGPFWYVLQPLLVTAVFSFLFGRMAGFRTDIPHYLFYMSGLVPWAFFADTVNKSSTVFTTNANLFNKVWFPRLCLPLAGVLTNLVPLLVQTGLFLIGFAYYLAKHDPYVHPNWRIILTPLGLCAARRARARHWPDRQRLDAAISRSALRRKGRPATLDVRQRRGLSRFPASPMTAIGRSSSSIPWSRDRVDSLRLLRSIAARTVARRCQRRRQRRGALSSASPFSIAPSKPRWTRYEGFQISDFRFQIGGRAPRDRPSLRVPNSAFRVPDVPRPARRKPQQNLPPGHAHRKVFWHDLARRLRGNRADPAEEAELFWALREVSFDLRDGEVLGLLGRNGAGKTTLLKVISRITSPTAGEVKMRGRVASLLEVGTGFHMELTGRDNVYLNGIILGMTRGEVRRKFDEIVAFSGHRGIHRHAGEALFRWACACGSPFAVAAHLEPEILLIDEVLAVGDAVFQQRCLARSARSRVRGAR
jgi:ABC-type polysaccharide/polyol phosphate transport system ATPase subunit